MNQQLKNYFQGKLYILLVISAVISLTGCIAGIGLNHNTDSELFPEPPRNSITTWGHATNYIDINGFGIITDPIFEPKYGIINKRFISAPPMSAYDQTDIILISHPHQDHLSPTTISKFPPHVKIFAPKQSEKYLKNFNSQTTIMKPGDIYEFQGGQIIAVAVHHPGYRYSLKARHDGRALGYIIRTENQTIFYSGDTEYFDGFKEIGRTYKPNLVILNLSTHMRTNDAIRTIKDLGVQKVIPSHYGAYGGGSNEGKTSKYRSELSKYLGNIWVSLQIGKSCSLTGEKFH
jgi:L-ascorbate metabolism protein UlaG (beta-lactamase superfamily)